MSLPTNYIPEHLSKTAVPEWINPMLATLTKDYFDHQDWIYERKWDGERALVFKKNGKVSIYSRNHKKINDSYPELEKAFESAERENFIADGEICAFESNNSSFSKLQGRMQIKDRKRAALTSIPVFYYFIDLLYIDRYLITNLPLRERKKILKSSFEFNDPLRFTSHRNENGVAYFEEACDKGWEGLIAKDAGASYSEGRSKKWLKFKCINRQEFVIGGYTEPEGSRQGFGALLIGYHEKDQLKYAGKVGTGYNDQLLNSLARKMQKIEIGESPFESGAIKAKKVHWVKPKLIGEVEFTEWTRDGKLRHSSFIGLRDDKKPADVIKEVSL